MYHLAARRGTISPLGLVATRVSKIFMVMLKVESAGLRCGSSPSGSAGVAKRSDPPGLGAGACWARAGATMTAPIIAETIQPSARVFMACTPFSDRPGGLAPLRPPKRDTGTTGYLCKCLENQP